MEGLGRGDELKERFARHIALPEIGIQGQQALRQAKVLLVGVGGLGSPIALYLAAAGVGTLGIIDPDVVSLSNLQRQVLYQESHVGLPKVECAARRLKALHGDMVIHTYAERLTQDNAASLFAQYDIIVDGCDNYATRYLMDEVCGALQKPYVYGSIGAFKGQVSVFHYGEAGSYVSLFPKEEQDLSGAPVMAGVMGVVPGVIGTLQAAEVVKLITGAGQPLAGRLLLFDLLTMQSHVLDLS